MAATWVNILFKDNGIGIDLEKHKDDIFLPFKRISTNIEGAGIGMYLVKTQIEALGGQIKAESETDFGTEFIISIPFSDL